MRLKASHIQSAAISLGLEPCLITAVVQVESRGTGFLPDGRPVILFEGHVFWRELQKRGINPHLLKMPDVLHQKPDRSKYKGGAQEHERLHMAALVNKEAALCSASWGLFQIMGFNFRECGFASVTDFVEAQRTGEAEQLESFCCFLRSQGLVGVLAAHDWEGFARRYNGPGFRANRYDEKLRHAYTRCVKEQA